MRKKGVEMSLNLIIIAAIGLLILVILAFLVINYVNNTREGLESCTAKYAGLCKTQSDCDAAKGTAAGGTTTDCASTAKPVCCKLIGG